MVVNPNTQKTEKRQHTNEELSVCYAIVYNYENKQYKLLYLMK